MASFLGYYFWGGKLGELSLSQKPFRSLSQLCICNHQYQWKILFALYISGLMDINMTLCCSTDHGYMHGLGWKDGPQTSVWHLTASGHWVHTWPLGVAWIMGHQHGLRWLHRLFILTWPPEAASQRTSARLLSVTQITLTTHVHLDLRLHQGLRPQHGPRTPKWLVLAPFTIMDIWGAPIWKVKLSLLQAPIVNPS